MQKNSKDNRVRKVSAEIKKVLSEYLLYCPLSYNKIDSTFLSITNVVISPCLQHAKVYVVPLIKNINNEECLEFFRKHISILRCHLGRKVRLKSVPNISFFIDDSSVYASRIESLLKNPQAYLP